MGEGQGEYMIRRCFLLVLTLLIPAMASAQAEAIVSRDMGIFLVGVDPATGGQPISVTNFTAVNCGLSKYVVGAAVINPNDVRFDDPADATKDCSNVATVSGPLAAVPFGTGYRVALRSRGATTVSGWSPLSNPFDRVANPPAPPTNVRVKAS